MEKDWLDPNAPEAVKSAQRRLINGTSHLMVELYRLVQQKYLLIGGVVSRQERHAQSGIGLFNMRVKNWENLGGEADHVAATDIGEIAVCSALFGDLNRYDERAELGAEIVSHGPPYYAWQASNTASRAMPYKCYNIFATPQAINVARLMGPALKGYIDIVDSQGFTLRHIVDRYSPHGGGIYASVADIKTVGTLEIDGTDLPDNIQPRPFDGVHPPNLFGYDQG